MAPVRTAAEMDVAQFYNALFFVFFFGRSGGAVNDANVVFSQETSLSVSEFVNEAYYLAVVSVCG